MTNKPDKPAAARSEGAGRRWPTHLFNGRVRTSTLLLVIAFIAVWWVYATYRVEPTPPAAPQVVPPGYVPDPAYTWVPRTKVQQPLETSTQTPTPTPTTTEPTEPPTPSPVPGFPFCPPFCPPPTPAAPMPPELAPGAVPEPSHPPAVPGAPQLPAPLLPAQPSPQLPAQPAPAGPAPTTSHPAAP